MWKFFVKHNDRIVAAREGQFLGCSFHPELTDDHRLTAYFVEMVKEAKAKTTCIIRLHLANNYSKLKSNH